MMQVTQSPFLQALGHAIINSLWQFALLWLLYFLINTLFKFTAHQKYTAALLLEVTGFIWFVGTLAFYYKQCTNIALTNNYNYSFNLINSSGTVKEKMFLWILRTEQFLPYLSLAYLLLLIFLSIRWLQSYLYTQQIKQKGLSKIDVDWRLFVQKLSEQLGIRRTVKIYLSKMVKTPLTIGVFKPIILVPFASINHLTTEQMEAVILHELAHIKRLDYLINLLLSVIEATLFFNPFMQLLSKHIKRERENSCDDWVLQYEYNAASYAKALLQIAMFQSSQPSFAMNATQHKEVLLTRVKRIIEKSERSFHYRHQLIALLFITTVLSSIAWLSPQKKKSATIAVVSTEVIVEPLAAKIGNPLFNPVFFLAPQDPTPVSISSNVPRAQSEGEKQVKRIKKNERLNHLPLAIPTKNKDLSLWEVAAPVIANPTPIAKNKIQLLSPRLIFNIDSTLLKRLFSVKWLNEIEKTEKAIRKNLTTALEKNHQSKQFNENETVINDINIALTQIKATKLKVLKSQPITTARVYTKSNSLSYQKALVNELKKYEQEDDDLKALAEEIQKVLEEAQSQYLAFSRIVGSNNVTYERPAIFYSTPESHSYSFEYSEKPHRRAFSSTVNTRSLNNCPELKKQTEAAKPAIEIEIKTENPVLPARGDDKKVSPRVKRPLPIIHI